MASRCVGLRYDHQFGWPMATLGSDSEKIDLVVTLGGDGTILHAASLFSLGAVPPVLSFSMGTLGFLLPFRKRMSICDLVRFKNVRRYR